MGDFTTSRGIRGRTASGVALALGASALVALAPTPASAATGPISYQCSAAGASFTLPLEMSSDAAPTAFYGDPYDMQITGRGTIAGADATTLHAAGWRSFSGQASDGVTVQENPGQPGPTLGVAKSIPETSLGDQATPTDVAFTMSTPRFTERRSSPGELTFNAGSFTADLSVTKADGSVGPEQMVCNRPGGDVPAITKVAWVARTQTALTLSETEAEYGENVAVRGTVTPGAGTAIGTLAVTVGGVTSTTPVNGSVTPVTLRDLRLGSYNVSAAFTPKDSVHYRESTTLEPTRLAVVKTRSKIKVQVLGKKARRPTRARIDVMGKHGTTASGKAKFVLRKPSDASYKKFRGVRLGDGKAVGRFGRLDRGRYRMTITYRGDNEHLRKQVTRTFWVRR
jgi:hypothetical protein